MPGPDDPSTSVPTSPPNSAALLHGAPALARDMDGGTVPEHDRAPGPDHGRPPGPGHGSGPNGKAAPNHDPGSNHDAGSNDTAGPNDTADSNHAGPNHPGGSALRREILTVLRQGGPASPDQLAARLGASRTGVLQQLRALESAALVTRQTVRHGVGRPRHLYDVTPEAQDLFPTNYDGLAAGLLAALGAVGGDALIEEVFLARRRQLVDRIRTRFADRLGPDASLSDRVRELAVLQDEQGYLCRAEVADGVVRLREHNCAIYHVAMGSTAACDAELSLFREVLGAEVVRETHIAAGDRCCTYRVIGHAADA